MAHNKANGMQDREVILQYCHCSYGEGSIHAARGPGDLQQLLQQRNYLKNINPRDTVNLNLRKAFLEYDKNLYVYTLLLPTSYNQMVSPIFYAPQDWSNQ